MIPTFSSILKAPERGKQNRASDNQKAKVFSVICYEICTKRIAEVKLEILER